MLQWAYAVFSFALNLAIWDNSSSNTNKALVSRESFGSKTFPYHFAMPQTMLWKLYSSTNLSCRLAGNLCIIFWGTAEAILAEFKVIRETLWQFTPITPPTPPPPPPPQKKTKQNTRKHCCDSQARNKLSIYYLWQRESIRGMNMKEPYCLVLKLRGNSVCIVGDIE